MPRQVPPSPAVPPNLARRRFVQASILGAGGLSLYPLLVDPPASGPGGACPATVPSGAMPPRYLPDHGIVPALVKHYPQLSLDAPGGGLKLVNILDAPTTLTIPELVQHGHAGGACFTHPAALGQNLVPWAPFFPRTPALTPLPAGLAKQVKAGRCVVKDDGSTESPVYGNKARKYEYTLPGLVWSRTKRIQTISAYGSNHAVQLAIANHLAAVRPGGLPLALPLELSLYPQPVTPDVCLKLDTLRAMGAHLRYLDGEVGTGLAMGLAYAAEHTDPGYAYIRPGGSNELSVLAHVDALLEVAGELVSNYVLPTPPDYLFVALGSGATTLGLLLGVHLLGWPTRVVAVASQDKGALERWVVGGDRDVPFAQGNFHRLAETTLGWLRTVGFPEPLPDYATLTRQLTFDNEAWRPAYGRMNGFASLLKETAAREGLTLDGTFTAKVFASIAQYGQRGVLAGKSVLFWNTYNRFDYARLLGKDSLRAS